MIILFLLALLTLFIIIWVTLLRPWLRGKAWACRFFEMVEPIELWVYSKSESILWARWQQFLGLVITLSMLFGGIDYTAVAILTPDWIDPILPAIPLILNLLGTIAERLRRDTTKPLEVVALPIDKPAAVDAALRELEATKAETVATVAAAKAEGAL